MKNRVAVAVLVGLMLVAFGAVSAESVNLTPSVKDDPLVRMPGTQPAPEGNVNIESPGRCINCHGGYNPSIEPGHNWQGSMMAQAARDFLFWACLTVAGQDSVSAIGTPNAVDICQRCHFPGGWLGGRSEPPNASAMTGADFDGVQCDFCHTSFDPFFETTFDGTREGSDWMLYWDETNLSGTPSDAAAVDTYNADAAQAANVSLFSGGARDVPFYTNNLPPANYVEAASGQYFVSATRDKRASFADAEARHGMYYSRFHKSKYFCGTCHDVSNPVLANLGADPNSPLPTETDPAYSYFHVERTFSEFMLSDYGQQGGSPGKGPFDPALFDTSLASNNISKCQDCHMRDGVGPGCDKAGVPIRPGQSVEHPNSGQPIHDLTGGNVWVTTVLASAVSGSPNYDPTNASLLNQGPTVLTLDLNAGQGINAPALLDGAERARQQLQLAATIENLGYSPSTGALSFRVQNNSGHKLISGFPEGRRMFLNIRLYAGGQLIEELNPYDSAAGTLKGLGYNYQPDPNGALPLPQALSASERYVDELVYEMHPSSTLTGENETFHFALATDRYKDNRIPPKGFRIGEAASRISQPRWHGADAPDLYTAAEYAGGYDDVSLTAATGADYVEVNLYYQTTSREYIEFLRDEINANPANLTLASSAYIVQTDPFFGQLKAWGDTIWDLWTHNMNVDGAAPFQMAQATFGTPPSACTSPTPTLLSAEPGNGQVTLTWSDVHGADSDVNGYNVYYDQSGKAQFVADAGLATSFTNTGLTNGSPYCYKVTSYKADCASAYSNVICAIPAAGNQDKAGADSIETGNVVVTGKGRTQTITFEPAGSFVQGDQVGIRVHVVATATGAPVEGATVGIEITGPEVVVLSGGPTDADGYVLVTWKTQTPNRKGSGGTAPGTYTAGVSDVSAQGFTWDGVRTSSNFTVQ